MSFFPSAPSARTLLRGQHTTEFAILMGIAMTAVVVVQYGVGRAILQTGRGVTDAVLQRPVITPPGYELPRTGCLDTTGDGLCDCLDTDRDAACDPYSSQSNSLAQESGPVAGRATVITETASGNSSSASISYQPIYTGFGITRTAVPRTSTSIPSIPEVPMYQEP